MQVKKRDGTIVEYDRLKIAEAMKKAFLSEQGSIHPETLGRLTTQIEEVLHDGISVEEIQDIVEGVLMGEFQGVAKAYILYRQHRTELRETVPDPDAVADYIHASKYARHLPDEKRRETFIETVTRVKQMHLDKFPDLKEDIDTAFAFVYAKKILPSMRSMQFAGKAIAYENARMYNCTFTLVDRPRVFSEILYLLLCGCGCGFSVQKHHVSQLPTLSKINMRLIYHHKIADSIEGWATAVEALMNGYIKGYYVQFDYSAIRPAGSPLRRSGGRAPGHLSIKNSLEKMENILKEAQGRHLRPVECYDIICHLSSAVLAGGIRRSSLIALFSQDDEEMLHSKDGIFTSHRALCNNSVVFNSKTTEQEFLDVMNLNRTNFGDPGFVFIDHPDMGCNPCGEITIYPKFAGTTGFGFCNLVEINTAKCETEFQLAEAIRWATFIATLQASYTDFKYLRPESKMIADRDALIGVSLTGIYDSTIDFTSHLLERMSAIVIDTNEETAMRIGIGIAVRCTCIKPSGTASLELGGISSGIHPNHARKYFRRITANPLEPIAQYFRQINPDMISVKPDGDWCITFPITGHYEPVTAIEFLEKIKHFYDNWILPGSRDLHHNISCTITVAENEWDDVFKFAFQYKPSGMTFLPAQSDKDIPYCPREKVTDTDAARYIDLVRNYTPIDYTTLVEESDATIQGAACEVELCDVPMLMDSGNGEQIFEGDYDTCFEFQGHTFKPVEQFDGYFIARML